MALEAVEDGHPTHVSFALYSESQIWKYAMTIWSEYLQNQFYEN